MSLMNFAAVLRFKGSFRYNVRCNFMFRSVYNSHKMLKITTIKRRHQEDSKDAKLRKPFVCEKNSQPD